MITSTSNQLVKRIRRLRLKKFRLREGLFFVEGLRVVAAAVEAGAAIEQLVWCDALLVSEFGRNLVTQSAIPITEVSDTVFRSISERDNPTGLGAIVSAEMTPLDQFTPPPSTFLIGLHEIGDPGNLGTIIRTVDTLGGDGVLLIGNTVDPWHPGALKASMGTSFNIPLFTADNPDSVIAWAQNHGIVTVATSAKAEQTARDLTPGTAKLLLMGSEKQGLSAETQTKAAHTISIPMSPRRTSSSLNLAVATAILIHDLSQQNS